MSSRSQRKRFGSLLLSFAMIFWAFACTPLPSDRSRFRLALSAYENGDHEAAFPEFLALANGGHVASQYYVGRAYANGEGVEQDYGEAVRWQLRVAERGLPEAQLTVGIMYRFGTGFAIDLLEAEYWLRLSAQQGLPQAQLHLAEVLSGQRPEAAKKSWAYLWVLLAMRSLSENELHRAVSLRNQLVEDLPDHIV